MKRTTAVPILIVTENAKEGGSIQNALEKMGFPVCLVPSGQQGIASFKEKNYPIILVDSTLSDVNCTKFSAKIKQSRQPIQPFLILLADVPSKINFISALKHGFDEVLTRPVNFDELTVRIIAGKRKISIENQYQKLSAKEKGFLPANDDNSSGEAVSESRIIQSGKLETLGKMTAGIIHEINTPIQYVSDNLYFLSESFTELMAGAEKVVDFTTSIGTSTQKKSLKSIVETVDLPFLQEEIPQAIKQTIEGVERISHIILGVRNLSRQNALEKVPVDINKLVQSSLELSRNEWKNVAEVTTSFASDLPKVICQPGELNQVALNLIINAAHAIAGENYKKNEGIIAITTRLNEQHVEIVISDSGPGISDELRDKIFQPFFTTKAVDKGTGQGLAISKKIIEHHGGSLTLQNNAERGCRFTISLPTGIDHWVDTTTEVKQNTPVFSQPANSSETPKSIVFVDDDPDLLKGLERMLRSMKGIWQMTFVNSAEKALAHIKENHCDIIVTDYRMKQMTGFELLTRVKENWPDIIRLMLSGETDHQLIMKTVGIAHQFIAKPADAEKLKGVILQTTAMKGILAAPELTGILSKIDNLPTRPELYNAIISELSSADPSVKRVGEIISSDAAMTSKVLQLVNSAFFSLPSHVSKPEEAVLLLGTDTVKSLVLHYELFSKMKLPKSFGKFFDALHHHTMRTGTFAKKIAVMEKMPVVTVDHCFMAGLLHDCGKLVLAANFQQGFTEVLERVVKDNKSYPDAEKDVFAISHDVVGAYLMGLWGLPMAIVEGILYHHTPMKAQTVEKGTILAVHAANALSKEIYVQAPSDKSGQPSDEAHQCDIEFIEQAVSLEQYERWRSELKKTDV